MLFYDLVIHINVSAIVSDDYDFNDDDDDDDHDDDRSRMIFS